MSDAGGDESDGRRAPSSIPAPMRRSGGGRRPARRGAGRGRRSLSDATTVASSEVGQTRPAVAGRLRHDRVFPSATLSQPCRRFSITGGAGTLGRELAGRAPSEPAGTCARPGGSGRSSSPLPDVELVQADVRDAEAVASRGARGRRGDPHRLPPRRRRVVDERRGIGGRRRGRARAGGSCTSRPTSSSTGRAALPRGRRAGAGQLLRPLEGGGRARASPRRIRRRRSSGRR